MEQLFGGTYNRETPFDLSKLNGVLEFSALQGNVYEVQN